MAYLHDVCVEEIALEGLDGITLACLWCRLLQRNPKFSLALDPKSKQFLWSGIVPNSDVEFYRLPEPRELPTFHHQYVTVDEGTGIIMIDQEVVRKDYTVCIINSAENDGIQGSCPTFKERVNVSREVRGQDGSKVTSLEKVQDRWGDSLVMVASPELRHSTLTGPTGDPSVELADLNYCLLEFIGRQRHSGISQVDLAKAFKITSVTMFHYGKDLLAHNFIDKLSCWCETSKRTMNFTMLMLRRFSSLANYITKGRYMMLASHITDFLETKPKKTAKVQVIKDLMKKRFSSWASKKDITPTFKKLYLMLQKMKVIQIIHAKGKCDLFNKVDSLKLLKKIPVEKEEPIEEEINDAYDPSVSSILVAELPVQFQVYNLIDHLQHRPQGINTQEMKRMLQLDKTSLRSITEKALRGNKLITSYLTDEGRQRINKFQTTDMVEEVSKIEDLDTAPSSSKQNPKDTMPAKALQTERYTMRRQKILDMIKKHKVHEGQFGMLRAIRLDEAEEGRTEKCDRRSVSRIIDRLVKEGLCKIFSTVVMSDDGKSSRTVNFITDTDMAQDDPQVLHIIQQVKFRIINYVQHYPVTNHIRNKKGKLQAKLPAVKKKRKKKKSKVWKRINKFETLLQPSDDETAPPSRNALLDDDEEKEDQDGADKEISTERRLILKKNFYGHLQKMEKLKVFHLFMWYIVYGMVQQEPAVEAPQPGAPVKQSEVITIKQEFDEDQLTPITAELDEAYLESSAGSRQQGTDDLIGQPKHQSVKPVQMANQSERCSNGVADGTMMETEKSEGGASGSSATASQRRGFPKEGSTTTNSHQGEISTSSHPKSQTALGLLESIQQGNVPTETESDRSASDGASLNATHIHDPVSVESPEPNRTANPDAVPRPKPVPVPSDAPDPTPVHAAHTEKHRVYLDVMDWRRFVKPLPQYQDITEGWCVLGDAVLSMPLVIFCKVVPLRYMIDKLSDYLNDPVKSLWLVKDLPHKMRSRLLEGRRYLSFLAREVDRLASMGLAIYTPHLNEGKEMLCFYICRNATLVDTSSSDPGSNTVSDKPYPVHKHHFSTLNDVEKFWFELKVICSDTPLGTSRLSNSPGQMSLKMRPPVVPRKLDSYKDVVIDDGRIPGDGKGAGGLDLSFYSHLKRNWTKSTFDLNRMVQGGLVNRFEDPQNKRLQRLNNPLQRKTVLLSVKPGAKQNVAVDTKLVNVEEHKAETAGGKGRKRKRAPQEESEERKAKRKRQEERRRAKEEKQRTKKERRLKTEKKKAVGLATRATFNWTPEEDSLLLLCRVASTILTKKLNYKMSITWETVHYVFSKKVPSFVDMRNKDAKNIATRSIRLLKDHKFKTNFAVCLGECAEDTDLMDSIPNMTGTHPPDYYTEVYEELIDKLQEKFRHRDGQVCTLPDDITSLRRIYNVEPIARNEKADKMFFNVENETDLKRLALHTIVLSSLMSQNASDYDAKLAYKLYEQYDASILHDVFLFCRLKGVISRAREGIIKQKRIAPSVPMSYHLSTSYSKHFRSEIPPEVPDEALTCLKTINEAEAAEGVLFPTVSPGACACQIMLLAEDQIKCTIVVPKQLVVVDSDLLDRETLKQMGLLKKDVDSDSESDTDEESEDEEEDEDDDANEGVTGVRMETIEGAAQGGETTARNDVGVVFEGVDGKVNNTDPVEGLPYLQEAKPSSPSNEGNVMGMLEELASGTQVEMAQTGLDGSLPTHSDHSYFISKETLGTSDGTGLTDGVGKSTTPLRPGGTGDTIQAVESKQTPKDSVDVAQDGGKLKITSESPQQRPAPRNPTMKCLAASQSSFTKWLLAQGHYAPGICGKGRTFNLQDNIVFSAFTLKLIPNFPTTTAGPDPSYKTNSCSSLLEYLIRPCEKLTGLETSCRSQERSQALYLKDLLTAKYITQQEASVEKLRERCSKLGHRSPMISTIIKVYGKINDAGFLGVTIPKLKRIMAKVNADTNREVPLLRCMDLLLQQQMVFEVGANELCLVAMEHVSLWCISSQRLVSCAPPMDSEPSKKRLCQDIYQETIDLTENSNASQRSGSLEKPACVEPCLDSRSYQTVDLTKELSASGIGESSIGGDGPEAGKNKVLDGDNVLEVSPKQGDLQRRSEGKVHSDIIDMVTDEPSTRDGTDAGSSDVPVRERADDVEDIVLVEQKTSQSGRGAASKRKQVEAYSGVYEPVKFLPYPWRKEDGTINQQELNKMMKGISLLVTEKPGIKESAILDNFKDVLRRVDCQRILKMMSELQLITRHCVHLPQPGVFNSKSRRQIPSFHYHSSVDCLIKIASLLNDHD